jgi:trans-aconitate 2-methyltransferase
VWNPDQYLRFAEPRLRPALDLIARIPVETPRHIADLGCGTGNITLLLAQRWPAAEVTGVDASANMLAKAVAQPAAIRWEQANLADWRPRAPVDLIFSNAALHWLPEHAALFLELLQALTPGGVLAVQMPRNFSAPSHAAMHDAARDGPWREKLAQLLIAPPPVAESRFYYELLEPHASSLDIWETEYLHVLEGRDAVKEWTKGSWLQRFLEALDESERSAFEADYARRVAAAYPPSANGKTLFPFRRLFIVLTRR